MNIVYLRIAGYIFQVEFEECKSSYIFEGIVHIFKTHYKGYFVSPEKKLKIDAYINFRQDNLISILKKKGGDIYLSTFKIVENKYIVSYAISELQIVILMRYILQKLLGKNGFFLHCSANNYNSQALIFIGNSGQGKSTISQFLDPLYPSIADDNALVRREENVYSLYQIPSIEKDTVTFKKTSKKYDIKYVFFLHKGRTFKIVPTKEIINTIEGMVGQIWLSSPNTKTKMNMLLRFIAKGGKSYKLTFPLNQTITLKNISLFLKKNV